MAEAEDRDRKLISVISGDDVLHEPGKPRSLCFAGNCAYALDAVPRGTFLPCDLSITLPCNDADVFSAANTSNRHYLTH